LEQAVLPVLHPFTVHFPIALLLLNLALTLLYLRRRDPFVERSAYGALVVGWWSAFVAIVSGVLELALNWPLPDEVVGWLNAHAASGIILLIIYGQALLRRRRDPRILDGSQRRVYLGLLGGGAALVLLSGWIGGHLVYELGFGVR
jgi:uncharacterized membrane protein